MKLSFGSLRCRVLDLVKSVRNMDEWRVMTLFQPSLPSTGVAIVKVSSPAGRLHVVEDDFSRITVIAVFASVNYAVMPLMNWMSHSAVGAQPDLWMPPASIRRHLQCHSISTHASRYGLERWRKWRCAIQLIRWCYVRCDNLFMI
jgi:hypothetical protein